LREDHSTLFDQLGHQDYCEDIAAVSKAVRGEYSQVKEYES
jgi:hypothetical protein